MAKQVMTDRTSSLQKKYIFKSTRVEQIKLA